MSRQETTQALYTKTSTKHNTVIKEKKRLLMNRKVLLVGIIFIIIVILLNSIVFADWTDGGYQYDSSTGGGNSGNSGGGAGPPDEEAGTEVTITEFCETYNICTALTIDAGIYCFLDDRDDPNVRRVVSEPLTFYGYANSNDVNLELDDYSISELIEANDYYYLEESFLGTEKTDITYEWNNLQETSIPWITKSNEDDVRLYRYEGKGSSSDENFPENAGCRAYGGYFFAYNETAAEMFGIDQNGNIHHDFEPWLTPYSESWVGVWNNIDAGVNIIWDENEFDCNKIGGEWLYANDYEDENGNGYQCCGDDYIWVNNRPLSEDETELDINNYIDDFEKIKDAGLEDDPSSLISLASNYCLYSSQIEGDSDPIGITNYGTYYTCDITGFDAYDEALESAYNAQTEYAEECYADDGKLLATCPFFITALYDDIPDTDIGKWSGMESYGSTANPNICRIKETEKGISAFDWKNVNDAGDAVGDNSFPVDIFGNEISALYDENEKANTICEKYLGGIWTGSHCCGNKYDYLGDYGDVGYYDESFSETTSIFYDDGTTVLHQYACLQANVYDTMETGTYTEDGSDVELLNLNGMWYSCNNDVTGIDNDWYTKGSLATSVDRCTLIESTYLCNYNYTDPENPRWEWYHVTNGEEGDYVDEVLGYDTGATFALSEPVWATAEQQSAACCANNRCWDGTQCVDEYTDYAYDYDSDGEEEHYICNDGSWGGEVETKYDWYHNTDAAAIDYCVNPYACVCSSNEDDETFCVEEGTYYEAGCTLTMDFYKDDHFCEALDTNSDGDFTDNDATNQDSSRWTSRTKLLAFQLLDIAQSKATDFTLFCDKYSNLLNNYVDVEAIAKDINSFCVLNQDNEVTIGVTFNSDDVEEPMTVNANELLFEGSNALIVDILDEDDVDDCDTAITATQTERFGEYYSCDGSTQKYWYNNLLKSFIYSKDGLTSSATLSYPDTNTYQELLDTTKKTIVDYINSNTLKNPNGDELNDDFEAFNYLEDYNRIYYSEQSGTTITGVEETKYNGESGNRYYLGVTYNGMTIDCNQIYAPYETTATIFCDSDAGIVLERSTTGSEYWNSLTAAVRQE